MLWYSLIPPSISKFHCCCIKFLTEHEILSHALEVPDSVFIMNSMLESHFPLPQGCQVLPFYLCARISNCCWYMFFQLGAMHAPPTAAFVAWCATTNRCPPYSLKEVCNLCVAEMGIWGLVLLMSPDAPWPQRAVSGVLWGKMVSRRCEENTFCVLCFYIS